MREAIGKAIIGLAKTGYRDTGHLANYGVYQGRSFIDRQVTQLSFAADHLPGWPTLGLVTLNGVNDALELGGLVRSLRAAAQRVSPKHEKRMHCVCFLQHGCRCRIFGRGRGMSLARLEAVACGFQVLHGGYALAINLTHGI